MKNKELWKPTKFIYRQNRLIASRDKKNVGVSSRLMADLVAKHYDIYLKQYAKGNLVDLGCGKVPLYEAYRNLVTDCTCVDWSSASGKNIHLDYECDLNTPIPLKGSGFDTVLLSDVLEHIKNPAIIWSEIARILKKGGRVILNVPFFYQLHEAPFDYFRYTEFALRNFAETNGFKILLLKPLGGAPEIMTDILAKNGYKIPVVGPIFSICIQKACSLFLKIPIGKKISRQTSVKFPIGYFLVAEKI